MTGWFSQRENIRLSEVVAGTAMPCWEASRANLAMAAVWVMLLSSRARCTRVPGRTGRARAVELLDITPIMPAPAGKSRTSSLGIGAGFRRCTRRDLHLLA
ncbi:Uncharacterised protein [Mycobacteroides abscessus subsp. abscessus]|nr:Uncharacterised protein [Mycobacteroides abscessus subsp. abscessus]